MKGQGVYKPLSGPPTGSETACSIVGRMVVSYYMTPAIAKELHNDALVC